MTPKRGDTKKAAVDTAYYAQLRANALATYMVQMEYKTASEGQTLREAAESDRKIAVAKAQADFSTAQATASDKRTQDGVTHSTDLVNSAIGAGATNANTLIGLNASQATAQELATHAIATAASGAEYAYATALNSLNRNWDDSGAGIESAFTNTLLTAGDTRQTAQRQLMGNFITGRATEQMTNLQSKLSSLTGTPGTSPASITLLSYSSGSSTPTTGSTTLTRQQADLILAQAAADQSYISGAVTAGNAFGGSLQSAQTAMRTTMLSLSESVRAAESLAQYSYSTATTAYTHSVDSAIENALFEFNNASIGADQLRDSQTVSSKSSAMQGLVSAEGASLKSQSAATKEWSRGIATANGNGAKNGAMFQVTKNSASTTKVLKGLTQTLTTGGSTGTSLLLLLNPHDPANQPTEDDDEDQNTPPSADPAGDLVAATNAADDTFDQANATAETARVTAVTGVRDGLDSGLAAADGAWGSTMDTAGAALGSALDGIQDFDWQHVRNYVGAVTGARKTAEIGNLNAQLGFMTSYTGAVNNYTGSIATGSVTHATGYAQSTADYYVNSADHEADVAEASGASNAVALRAKADAFAAFAGTYVSYLTSEAQSAATTAMTNVASANTNALAAITAEVATSTTDINTFYNNQVTIAANPPPVDNDLNDDGIVDPPKPTATESITLSINTTKTANTTARTVVHTAFVDQTARRTTSTTTSYTLPATNTPASSGSGPTLYQTPGTTPPEGTPPVVLLPPTPTVGELNPNGGLQLELVLEPQKVDSNTFGEPDSNQRYFYDIRTDESRSHLVRFPAGMLEAVCGIANTIPKIGRTLRDAPAEVVQQIREEEERVFDKANESTGVERFAHNTAGYVFLPATEFFFKGSIGATKAGHLMMLPPGAQLAVSAEETARSGLGVIYGYNKGTLTWDQGTFFVLDATMLGVSIRNMNSTSRYDPKLLGDRGVRNIDPLTPAQVQELEKAIKDLGIDPKDVTILPDGKCIYYPGSIDHITLGKESFPASGQGVSGTAYETMTPRAVLAHEVGHMITTRAGTDFASQSFMDELQASLVGRTIPGLTSAERTNLLREAVQRCREEGVNLRDVLDKLKHLDGGSK